MKEGRRHHVIKELSDGGAEHDDEDETFYEPLFACLFVRLSVCVCVLNSINTERVI